MPGSRPFSRGRVVSGGRGRFDVCCRSWSPGGWSCSCSGSDSASDTLNEGGEVEELGVVVVEKELRGDDRKRRDRLRRRARREAEEAAMDATPRGEEKQSGGEGEGRGAVRQQESSTAGAKPSAKPSCHGSGGRGRCMGRTASPRWAGLCHHGALLWNWKRSTLALFGTGPRHVIHDRPNTNVSSGSVRIVPVVALHTLNIGN